MVSRIDELEKLVIQGRKPPKSAMERFRRMFTSEGKLTGTEKRQLRNLAKKARENVDYYNITRDIPELSVTITEGNLSEPFDRRNIEPVKSKGESRADIKARVKGETAINPSRSGAKTGTTKTIKVKSGDTLSAIARKNNTTVAALMKMNPKIENKNEIRTGQFINVGSPTRATAKTKSAKSLRGDPTSVTEAKRRGMSYYVVIDSKGKKTKKAAVTADELKKSGLSLRAYLNKMKKKKK